MVIFVFTNANRGIIIKFTGFASACSNFSKVDSFSSGVVGKVIATNTPAIVA
jgi:hypothetical protein